MSRGTSRARQGPGAGGRPGPAGPARPEGRSRARGISSVDALAGTACKTFDGANGHVEVGSTATDLITLDVRGRRVDAASHRATPGS